MKAQINRKLNSRFPELLHEWDYESNTINPNTLTFGSSMKVFWKCKKGHRYQSTVNNRTKGRGCPFCSRKRVEKGRSLKDEYGDLVALEWGMNNSIKPEEVSSKSSRVVEWKCIACTTVWHTRIYNRTVRRSGCPVCARRRRLSFEK